MNKICTHTHTKSYDTYGNAEGGALAAGLSIGAYEVFACPSEPEHYHYRRIK